MIMSECFAVHLFRCFPQEYITDSFGLASMVAQKRLTTTAVPGIEHAQWLHNQTNFELFVMGHLM